MTCTLTNTKKDAYITINCWNTSICRNDVRMLNSSGRTIWSERGAIACNGKRQFRLGKNNKVYKIQVKTQKGKGTANALAYQNCTVK